MLMFVTPMLYHVNSCCMQDYDKPLKIKINDKSFSIKFLRSSRKGGPSKNR